MSGKITRNWYSLYKHDRPSLIEISITFNAIYSKKNGCNNLEKEKKSCFHVLFLFIFKVMR